MGGWPSLRLAAFTRATKEPASQGIQRISTRKFERERDSRAALAATANTLKAAPPRSPDPAYITSVPVILVAGVPASPVVAGVPALPVVAGVPALPVVAGVPALPVLVALPAFIEGAIVPVVAVAAFTVVPVVVVAAAPVPVVAPPRIPPLAGAPVIIRERRRLGLGDGTRPQTREPQTGGHDDR